MNRFFEKIFFTEVRGSLSLLRLVLGFIFVKEGAGKLFGWFGGFGFEALHSYLVKLEVVFPRFMAYFVGWSEFICGILLVLGFLVRPAAFLISCIMAVAILLVNRTGGYQYPLLIIAVCIVLIQMGAGRFSLDKKFTEFALLSYVMSLIVF
jgi:putative oxidoreductase